MTDKMFIGGPDPDRRPDLDGEMRALDFQEAANRSMRRLRLALRVFIALCIGALVYLTIGCGVTPVGQSAQQAMATGVAVYCAAPIERRRLYRELVAASVRPHRIEVKCFADDAPDERPDEKEIPEDGG